MKHYSDAIAARYSARGTATDTFGREIEVRRLRPAESFWVRQIAPSDHADITTEAVVASSVCRISDASGKPIELNPPRTGQELGLRLDYLETEGMTAAMTAYARLMGAGSPQPAGDQSAVKGNDPALDGGKGADTVAPHLKGHSDGPTNRSRRDRRPSQQASE